MGLSLNLTRNCSYCITWQHTCWQHHLCSCHSASAPTAALASYSVLDPFKGFRTYFKVFYGQEPANLWDRLFSYETWRALHSANQHCLVISGPEGILLASAPYLTEWAPTGVWSLWDLFQFSRASKMELFHKAFSWGSGHRPPSGVSTDNGSQHANYRPSVCHSWWNLFLSSLYFVISCRLFLNVLGWLDFITVTLILLLYTTLSLLAGRVGCKLNQPTNQLINQ